MKINTVTRMVPYEYINNKRKVKLAVARCCTGVFTRDRRQSLFTQGLLQAFLFDIHSLMSATTIMSLMTHSLRYVHEMFLCRIIARLH